MDSFVRMDKGDVEMMDAETNVPASDVLVSNESPVKYENDVKTGKSNDEDKTHDQSDSKGEDLRNDRSETEDRLNSKSQPEAHDNVVLENKTPTIDGDASPMFLINPSTANVGQHSGEASENIYAMMADGEDDEGSPEDQAAFIGKLGTFYREKAMEFKLPKFYGHPLNCLKLWRSVIRLGGYDRLIRSSGSTIECNKSRNYLWINHDLVHTAVCKASLEGYVSLSKYHSVNLELLERVTGYKLWRQVGDSFNPPKTCTTVSWTFRSFYEKLLLQYERHRTQNGELQLPIAPPPGSSGVENEGSGYQISASGREVRDSAARCRLGWQEQHLLGYGEVAEPIVKDRSAYNTPKRAKSLSGSLKHQGQNEVEHPMKAAETETSKQLDVQVVDVGPPADWVKINVRETNESFEVYALVPGLLQEEVRVQSDPAGRLVITGQPNQLDNLWGITAFKKVVTLPARIDQLRTNADVTLHGCLHVHVPFAQQNL